MVLYVTLFPRYLTMVKLRDLLKTLMTPDPRDNLSKTSSCDSRENSKRGSSFFASFRSPATSRSPTTHSVHSLNSSRSSSAFSVLTSEEEELGKSPTVPAVVSSLEGLVIAFPCFVRVLEQLSRAHVTGYTMYWVIFR